MRDVTCAALILDTAVPRQTTTRAKGATKDIDVNSINTKLNGYHDNVRNGKEKNSKPQKFSVYFSLKKFLQQNINISMVLNKKIFEILYDLHDMHIDYKSS